MTRPRWHMRPGEDDKPRRCVAQTVESCDYYVKDPESVVHGYSATEVERIVEAKLEAINRVGGTWSFVREQERQLTELEAQYEGVPAGFFRADLQEKVLDMCYDYSDSPAIDELEANEQFLKALRMWGTDKSYERITLITHQLTQLASSPKDDQADDATLIDAAETVGFRLVSDPASNVLVFRHNENDDHVMVVLSARRKGYGSFKPKGVNDVQMFALDQRLGIGDEDAQVICRVDSGNTRPVIDAYGVRRRALIGAARIKKITGEDVLEEHRKIADERFVGWTNRRGEDIDMKTRMHHHGMGVYLASRRFQTESVPRIVRALEDCQSDYPARKAQLSDGIAGPTGASARVYETKRNITKRTQAMMDSTSLKQHFGFVEIDDSVDSDEFVNFEAAVGNAMTVLPKPREGREPDVRIRMLGRHKADGIYFPAKNTLCVDVRDSTAFVHEYAHYLDHQVKGDASLQSSFKSIAATYARSCVFPAEMTGKKQEYYKKPTEILARGFEVYAVERLHMDNRLVDPSKFDRFDYKVFQDNPELKAELFAFIDGIWGKEMNPLPAAH